MHKKMSPEILFPVLFISYENTLKSRECKCKQITSSSQVSRFLRFNKM